MGLGACNFERSDDVFNWEVARERDARLMIRALRSVDLYLCWCCRGCCGSLVVAVVDVTIAVALEGVALIWALLYVFIGRYDRIAVQCQWIVLKLKRSYDAKSRLYSRKLW